MFLFVWYCQMHVSGPYRTRMRYCPNKNLKAASSPRALLEPQEVKSGESYQEPTSPRSILSTQWPIDTTIKTYVVWIRRCWNQRRLRYRFTGRGSSPQLVLIRRGYEIGHRSNLGIRISWDFSKRQKCWFRDSYRRWQFTISILVPCEIIHRGRLGLL